VVETLETRVIAVSIPCGAQALYDAIYRPEVFPAWASGLSGAALKRDGEAWTAQGPEGPIRISFTDRNPFGVMDHWVELGDGRVVYVPMRVVANGEGSEVMVALFRQPWMTADQFARDEAWVRRDLARLKQFVASRKP
jgi:hypothetical protein